MADNINTNQPRKGGKRKWLLLGLGLLAATGLTVFGIQYYRKHKRETEDENAPDFKAEKPKTAAPGSSTKSKSSKAAVIAPAKKSATANTTSHPNSVPKTAESQPGQNAPPKPFDSKKIAVAIHAAAVQKNFAKAYKQLRNIKSTRDYSSVSKIFSTMFLNGVRQTLVNGLLTTFKDAKQKDTLNKSFRAMGLKFDGKKWSLSGAGGNLIITTTATNVWKDPKTSVQVPVNMVLGKEVCERGNFTLFENDNHYFLVESLAVKPYQS